VSLDDWILALHLLAAFMLIGGAIGVWATIVAGRSATGPDDARGLGRIMQALGAVTGIGSVATLIFGIWLALSLEGYEIWDGWIVAAIVLWLVGGAAGGASGRVFARAAEGGDATAARRGVMLHGIATVAFVLILIDMIWKPGA
jgi:uncharacterized membrane protein